MLIALIVIAVIFVGSIILGLFNNHAQNDGWEPISQTEARSNLPR